MNIAELLNPWVALQLPDLPISGLQNDSRKVGRNDLFIAYPGAATDGRLFIAQALQQGAAFVVYEPHNWPSQCSLPDPQKSVAISGLSDHLAAIASRFYEEPSKQLQLIAVTGTNGKTTIAYQLAQAHELLSMPSAYIGTLGCGAPQALTPLNNTTPDALCLQQLLHSYSQEGIKQVCMEVSSHALAQGRVAEIAFKQAIFTNLTLDHLDYHHTMEAYAASKALLFGKEVLQWAIINQDDDYASVMKEAVNPSCQTMTYGIQPGSDVQALHWNISLDATVIDIASPWGNQQLHCQALGFFNIYNTLAIFTSLMLSGYALSAVVDTIAKLKPAPGRMEIVSREPYILVDYAHTPDALENVLRTLNEVKKGRLLVVFGCGGDRDKSKRPIMGEIAAKLADVVIVTSDNPRTENPSQIIHEVAAGIISENKPFYSMIDRKEAIENAIALANPEDIVLVAGKGHEAYQQIGAQRFAFSDQEIIKELSLQEQDSR